MHKCYFCHSELNASICYKCPSKVEHFYRINDNTLSFIIFFTSIKNIWYTVFLDFNQNTCEIMDAKEVIMQFNQLTNITPFNASKKIKTLLVFS